MIKRVIIIAPNYFCSRDYHRFGVETLEKNGFVVEVWDPSHVLYGNRGSATIPSDAADCKSLTLFQAKSDLYRQLKQLGPEDFVFNTQPFAVRTLGIYRALSLSRAQYGVNYFKSIPTTHIENSLLPKMHEKLKKLKKYGFEGLMNWVVRKFPQRLFQIRPARLLLDAAGSTYMHYKGTVDNNTEVVKVHSFDYDLYLQHKSERCSDKPRIVFLDEFFPLHPEFAMFRKKVPIEIERYYDLLCQFFSYLEQKTGFEVIIAAHPKSNYETRMDYFKGRTCVKGQTVQLVKESKLVMCHASTAINFAVLFHKPLLFVTFHDFDGTIWGERIEAMAQFFSKKPVHIDREVTLDMTACMHVEKSDYERYKELYIKTSDSEDLPYWEIVSKRLKKGL